MTRANFAVKRIYFIFISLLTLSLNFRQQYKQSRTVCQIVRLGIVLKLVSVLSSDLG